MRNTHKLVLAVVMAITVMACGASSASAVSLTSEPGGAACDAAYVGGIGHTVFQGHVWCSIHATSTELIDLEVFGATISRCNNEFSSQFGANGAGFLHTQTLTGAECAVVPCNESGSSVRQMPWPAQISEFAGAYSLTVTFCVQGSTTTNCTVTVPMTVTGHTVATFSGENPELNCAGTGGLIQVHGTWTTEQNQGVEIAM